MKKTKKSENLKKSAVAKPKKECKSNKSIIVPVTKKKKAVKPRPKITTQVNNQIGILFSHIKREMAKLRRPLILKEITLLAIKHNLKHIYPYSEVTHSGRWFLYRLFNDYVLTKKFGENTLVRCSLIYKIRGYYVSSKK